MLCQKGCFTVIWCPLKISWATTIHKFQGFEAGFDDSDMFCHLIVDPGDLKWEQTCPGALYVALSRAKTMGTYSTDTSFPRDSAISTGTVLVFPHRGSWKDTRRTTQGRADPK